METWNEYRPFDLFIHCNFIRSGCWICDWGIKTNLFSNGCEWCKQFIVTWTKVYNTWMTMECMFSCVRMINSYYLLIHFEIVSPMRWPMYWRIDFDCPPIVGIATKWPCAWRWPLTSDKFQKRQRSNRYLQFISLHYTYVEKHWVVYWEEVIRCYVFGFFHVLQFQIEQIKLRTYQLCILIPFPIQM